MDPDSDTGAARNPSAGAFVRNAEVRWLIISVTCMVVLQLGLALLLVPGLKEDITTRYTIGSVDGYQMLAKNISHGRGYRFTPDTSLTLMREPGYPYFLAVLVHEFDDYHRASAIANILFTALSALLIFHLTRLLTPVRWAPVIAAIVYMLHPGVIVTELRSGVEVPFTLLLLIFFLLLRTAVCTESTSSYVRAGIALGVATYVRSTALLFPVFLICHGLVFDRDWRSVLRSASRAVLVIVCALLILSPWIIRNYELVGKFVPTASVKGIAMQVGYYQCLHADGRKEFVDLDFEAADARKEIAAEQGYKFTGDYLEFFYDPRDEVKFSDFLGAQVVQRYLHSPGVFLKCASENVFNFWFQGKTRAVTRANLVIQSFYLVMAAVGILIGFKQMHKPTLSLMLLLILYTMGLYAPIHAQARYSIPIVPLLSIFASIPLSALMFRRFHDPR